MRHWVRITLIAVIIGCGRTPAAPPAPGAVIDTPDDDPRSPPAGEGSVPPPERDVIPPAAEGSTTQTPAEATSSAAAAVEPLEPERTTSIGSPTDGALDGGVALPARARGLSFLPTKDPSSRFGTVELVQGLVAASAAMDRASPGVPVTIGDLSREHGGAISGHASHRSGRDVDVLFFLLREDGRPFFPSKFIPLDPQGHGTDYGDLADPRDDVPVHLDTARTWRWVAALLAEQSTPVQKILIVEHLRTRLLAEARRVNAPAAIVQRFSDVTCQPRFPHDDHMHIRVFCSADDIERGCEDTRPIFPWRVRELRAIGVAPVRAGSKPRPAIADKDGPTPKPALKTIARARAEAGPMHEDVVEFLDRRESWARKPHPGRRWCR